MKKPIRSVPNTKTDWDNIGQNFGPNNGNVTASQGARGFNILSGLFTHHLAPHQPEELDPTLKGQGQNQVAKTRPHKSHHGNSEDEKRESHQQIGKAREGSVEPAPVVTGQGSQGCAHRYRNRHGQDYQPSAKLRAPR